MDENKFSKIHTQMRENQTELQDFLKDLDSWEGDIKQKDTQLKNNKVADAPTLPPVRNSLQKKKKKKKKKPKETTKEKTETKKKIKGSDFRAWDKYNVDEALAEIGDSDSKSSSEYETDEEWEIERKKQQALIEKDQGNDNFKRGKYPEAIECYTRGIEHDPTNPLLPANRAMALLKLEQYGAAEVDCTMALALDPSYPKAYMRRGAARVGLGKLKEATQDFNQVLKMEPNNKQAKLELEKVEKLASPVAEEPSGRVSAIHKPAHLRSQKPLRRVDIEEIGMEGVEERKQAMTKTLLSQSQTKQKITQHDDQLFNQKFAGASNPGEINTTDGNNSGDKTTDMMANTKITSPADLARNATSSEVPRIELLELDVCKSGNQATAEKNSGEGNGVSSKDDVRKGAGCEVSGGGGIAKGGVAASPETSPRSPRIPLVPSTSFQFQADFKVLRNHPESLYEYIKQINPSTYPKVFGESLESDNFLTILRTLKDYYIRDSEDVFPTLKSLSDVKRFNMTVMFLSSQEKQVVKDLFSHLTFQGQHEKTLVERLAKKYGV